MFSVSVCFLSLCGAVFADELDPSLLQADDGGVDSVIDQMQNHVTAQNNNYVSSGAGGVVAQKAQGQQSVAAVNSAMNKVVDAGQISTKIAAVNNRLQTLDTCMETTKKFNTQLKDVDNMINNGLKQFQENQQKMTSLGGNDVEILNMISIMMSVNEYLIETMKEQFSPTTMKEAQKNLAAQLAGATQGTSPQGTTMTTAQSSKDSETCAVQTTDKVKEGSCKKQGSGSAFIELQQGSGVVDNPSQSNMLSATGNSKNVDGSYQAREDTILNAIYSGTGQSPLGNAQVVGHSHNLGVHSVVMIIAGFFCAFASGL